MGIGAVDNRSQLWLGGLRTFDPLIDLKLAMTATVFVEGSRGEAEV